MKISTHHDACRITFYRRAETRVGLVHGRGASTKIRRLVAAGFRWDGVLRADGNGDVDGDWIGDGRDLVECFACGPEAEAAIRVACGGR